MGGLSGVSAWVVGVVQSLGYVGLAALIALENVFPPLPSELILPLAGFLAGRGQMSFPLAIIAATAGSLAGAYVWYGIGRAVGETRVRHFIQRRGRWLLLDEEDLDKSRDWFERHGGAAVFFGRLIPGVRSFISIPAGVEKMPLLRFSLYTTAGSALWNTVLISLGWLLGDQWTQVRQYASIFEYAVLAILAALVAWFIVRRVKARRTA